MELTKKSIHTERIKAKALLQIPLEEDVNVSDTRPDVGELVFHRGKVKIDEIKTAMSKIWVKGKLVYNILYLAEGKEAGLANMEGELPFMEEIYMEQVDSQDRAICATALEDMRVNIINSRKLSIQSVISLMPRVEETLEEEICTDIVGSEKLEYRRKGLDYLETAVCKRDLFRIHEENKLPAGMPNIGTPLWKSADITQVSFQPMEEKIGITGEIALFVMYQDDTNDKTNWYETTIPFVGSVECMGCQNHMTADITYETGHEEISIREDADGETRVIGIELTMEMEIKLLSPESTQIVADVYGVTCEVDAITQEKDFQKLLQDTVLQAKLSGKVTTQVPEQKILQICHSSAQVELEGCTLHEDEMEVKGNLNMKMLYLTGEEVPAYSLEESSTPFTITRQIIGLKPDMEYSLHPQLEQFHTAIKEGNQAEWKANVDIRLLLYDVHQEQILSQIHMGELDADKLEKLPGFAIYFVKAGDSLWQIGKKYYVSVEKIKEINKLTSDEIKPGDKLLIVKAGEI